MCARYKKVRYLLAIIYFLLILLTVAHGMVDVMVDHASQSLVLSQVPLIVADSKHGLALTIQFIVIVHIICECPFTIRNRLVSIFNRLAQ